MRCIQPTNCSSCTREGEEILTRKIDTEFKRLLLNHIVIFSMIEPNFTDRFPYKIMKSCYFIPYQYSLCARRSLVIMKPFSIMS